MFKSDYRDEISGVLKGIAPLSDENIERFIDISNLKEITKGEDFICEGETPKYFGYVIQGLFRYYYIDKKGNEFTKGFFPEKSFISSYSAQIQHRGSYFTIEALEDSLALVTDVSKWELLLDDNLAWYVFLLKLIEKGYCIKESREREFLLFNADERYASFVKMYPGLDKRIKQRYIASYIGITPVAFSRIKKSAK